ncbi:MAG: asparagine synthase (glutamine-hydrolyzing), partial [Nitrospirales bacterium]
MQRGPDDEGRHREPGLHLGARRLRVIDLEGGHQPMANETGTVWVALNGEIYNYRELREELISKGHRFASRCDTEVLAHLYEQEGEDGVQRLRGMFAFALWDRNLETLYLVRDGLGIKPLYFYQGPLRGSEGRPTFSFASELPALMAALPSCTIHAPAIAEYLRLLYVPGPETVLEGVEEVRPGELVRFRRGQLTRRRFFHLARLARPTTMATTRSQESELAEQFITCLKHTVNAHLISDVPLGMFLSGGLDSGAILAMMRALSTKPIRTFSIGYEAEADRSYDETEAARLLARHFQADHTEQRLRPDAVTLLPKIVAAMGEPFADSSAIPTYLVSQVARQAVTVALSGIGGDELFGGYPRYLGIRAARPYTRLPRRLRAWVAGWLPPLLREREVSQDHRGRFRRFFRHGHEPIADQYLRWMRFLPAEWEDRALTTELRRKARSETLDRRYRHMFEDWPSADPADRAMALDLQTYLPDDLLRMGDRLSMAHSLELRVPFCDQELLTMALAIPAHIRLRGWRLKGFMRRALHPLLPREILGRPKFGFQVPVARWLREDLREMVRDLLTE